ncbi:type II toxin-antitoxin system HicA family toxin [Lactobacillus sp. YT155]|uniref:type II toxin-antitoxin system HicA family toxin n=1 Tax=Lactobacillus sp. YT155 TaxID=3060955 RepID=UPI00265DB2A6|nr:type II toxin-antitoxin system HicA family toxin [Lactobacillus sp. YT155]MDO1604720.1 type II toxin-antitoxin system HicA family toxin [Lactobacillus sp. YT155]
MKTNKLLKLLKQNGWYLYRHGGNHDIWTNEIYFVPIPRHPKIKENLAKSIIKKYRLIK